MRGEELMRLAIGLARESVSEGGGPFGAVVARQGQVLATGKNRVTLANDPTAHAEIAAIRAACGALGGWSLAGCELYSSCEPCPMCLAAAAWARLDRVVYSATRDDAARAGFDDERLHRELALPASERSLPLVRLQSDESRAAFQDWSELAGRRPY